MLQSCLQLNPYFRMTANECLNAKLFDSVRDPTKERILLSLKQRKMARALAAKNTGAKPSGQGDNELSNICQIQLPVDAADAFDYEKPENAKYKVDEIKRMLAKAIVNVQ